MGNDDRFGALPQDGAYDERGEADRYRSDDEAPATTPVPSLTVSGGAGGVRAQYDDMRSLGRLYGEIGPDLVGYAWDDRLEAADGDLIASSVLSPGTFARAEGAILDATYGPRGLVVRAATVEAQAVCFVAVVELYESADQFAGQTMDALAYGTGLVAGLALPGVLLVGAGGLAALLATNPLLATALARAGYDHQDALRAGLTSFLEDHPELLQGVVDSGGGLLDGLLLDATLLTGGAASPLLALLGLGGLHPDTQSAADALGALLFEDRPGALNADYQGPRYDFEPPRDAQDLLEDLGTTNEGEDGVITIQRVVGPDGQPSWVVHLPGTDDFWSQDDIRNMGSNFNLIAGDDTAYAQAISKAMQEAGVGADDPVLLTGHSQGGMQAAALAADPAFGYNVTNVVTAGAPVALSDVPPDVDVISLENTGDVVPLLDGEENPRGANHVTVQADVHTGSIGDNHSVPDVYTPMAGAADHSADPSVQAALADLYANGFLHEAGDPVNAQTYTYQTQVVVP